CTPAGCGRYGPPSPRARTLNVLSSAADWGVGRAAGRADADTGGGRSEDVEAERVGAVERAGANSADTISPLPPRRATQPIRRYGYRSIDSHTACRFGFPRCDGLRLPSGKEAEQANFTRWLNRQENRPVCTVQGKAGPTFSAGKKLISSSICVPRSTYLSCGHVRS
ncbi:MAG: hypothetical protein JWR48_6250, partial [Mycobacterium sp.]|nr:hypothetical protein [Mycobacterium sp.]